MLFPFKGKVLKESNSEKDTLLDYSSITEIPVLPHPGAFSCVRKNHIHEGIDLYCLENENVYSMESGKVVNISIFTGEDVATPWWNTTWCVMVEGFSGVINYGEIKPSKNLYIGQMIEEGVLVGTVTPVLKKGKGRPMNMLHLELYETGTTSHLACWELNTEKPKQLLDSNILLKDFLNKKNKIKF